MVACTCHLIFCHKTLVFQKNIVVTTHYFLSHNTLFFQKILCCAPCAHTIFFEKIMCCGKFVITHYFFKILCCEHGAQDNIFWKNNVLWQKNKVADTCHHTQSTGYTQTHSQNASLRRIWWRSVGPLPRSQLTVGQWIVGQYLTHDPLTND